MIAEELERLAKLHSKGALTDAEYEAAKRVAIGRDDLAPEGTPSSTPPPDAGTRPTSDVFEGATPPRRRQPSVRLTIIFAVILVCIAFVGLIVALGMRRHHAATSATTTGSEIAAEMRSQLADTNGTPVSSVDCPNERLVLGDSIDCTVHFSDGSFKSFVVTWEESGGHPKIEIGVPK